MSAAASTSSAAAGNDLEPLCEPLGLYVKPLAKLIISVSLPPLKQPGQSISNWDLTEKIKKAVSPVEFCSIRVLTSTSEVVQFEAELSLRKFLTKVIKALDGYSLKVMGFFAPLKVRAAEAKMDFPTRHDWDEFFRNEPEMNELRCGERPDTIYLSKVPSNWFKEWDPVSNSDSMPSESTLRRVFERFGAVRCVDIPACDPYRKKMSAEISGIRTTGFSFGQEILFEGYVQFNEYLSFVKAMDFLRNKKLVKKMPGDRIFEAAIKVDFDKSKHLSDKHIRKRQIERDRLKEAEGQTILEKRTKREEEVNLSAEKERASRQVEQRDKQHLKRQEEEQLKKQRPLKKREAECEEEKILRAQRKLESERLLSVLFREIEAKQQETSSMPVKNLEENSNGRSFHSGLEAKLRMTLLREHEKRLRRRIEAKMNIKKLPPSVHQ